MNRVYLIKVITSTLLIASLFGPIVLKSFPLLTENQTKAIGINKAPNGSSKIDLQLLCEEKEKEEEFRISSFQGVVLVTGLIADLTHFSLLCDHKHGLVVTKPRVSTTPLYLIKQSLII